VPIRLNAWLQATLRRRLRDFHQDVASAGPVVTRPARSHTVEVADITGSVGRSHELAADFRPRRSLRRRVDDQRLERIRRLMERGHILPSVELYKLGDNYYVLDGHHRVAAARLNRQVEIDAHVVEYVYRDATCCCQGACAA
jgi:hypothetical protein